MNLIFGTAGGCGADESFDRACRHIRTRYAGHDALRKIEGPSSTLGLLATPGRILGFAESGDVALSLLGGVHLPLRGWQEGSPLDDPNATATFLLHRYMESGHSFLDGVQGQYAITVNDNKNDRLLLACDPGGMRTFYTCTESGRLHFSTSLSVSALLSPQGPLIDRSWEDFFLIYGFYPFNRTPYQGIRSLPAGTVLEWSGGACRTHRIEGGNPWENSRQDLTEITQERHLVDKLYDSFMEALEDQAASSDRAAVLLGGVDSALVASGLRRLGKQVETFSFSYQESRYNQPHVDTVAKHLDIRHQWVPITPEMIAQGLESFPNDFNAPTNWPNYVIQTRIVCDQIRKRNFEYCYSGDGCDTIFLGYPGTHRRTRLLASLPTLPPWLAGFLLRATAFPALEKSAGHPYRVFLNVIRSLGRPMPERCHVTLRIFDEISLSQLRRDPPPEQEMNTASILRKLVEPVAALTPERLGYHGKALISPNKNKLIGSSDSCGVIINSPYMHNGFKAVVSALPDTLSRPTEKTAAQVTGKYILLKMAESKGLLPHDVIYQKKVAAVAAPIDKWYMGPLKQRLLSILADLPFEADASYMEAMFSDRLLERIYRDHISPSEVTSDSISLLATYAGYCGLRT